MRLRAVGIEDDQRRRGVDLGVRDRLAGHLPGALAREPARRELFGLAAPGGLKGSFRGQLGRFARGDLGGAAARERGRANG